MKSGPARSLLDRLLTRLAALAPRRHRDVVRGMLAELDAIDDSTERVRFALGAVVAIAHLAVAGHGRATVRAPVPILGAGGGGDPLGSGGPYMATPTYSELLRRLAPPFAVALGVMTVPLAGNSVGRQLPQVVDSVGLVELVLLNLPHVLALTVPMSVFVSVSWVFARLGKEGALDAARANPVALRRLLTPVVGAAALVGGLALVLNTQVLPRTNAQLKAAFVGATTEPSDRTMTVSELSAAARSAEAEDRTVAATAYRIEIHKKFALAAACIFLALLGAALPIRFPRGGLGLTAVATGVVFIGYYMSIVVGEAFADRLLMSPFVSMWMANAILTVAALLLFARRGPAREGLAVE